jgi:hypothetical protein
MDALAEDLLAGTERRIVVEMDLSIAEQYQQHISQPFLLASFSRIKKAMALFAGLPLGYFDADGNRNVRARESAHGLTSRFTFGARFTGTAATAARNAGTCLRFSAA